MLDEVYFSLTCRRACFTSVICFMFLALILMLIFMFTRQVTPCTYEHDSLSMCITLYNNNTFVIPEDQVFIQQNCSLPVYT